MAERKGLDDIDFGSGNPLFEGDTVSSGANLMRDDVDRIAMHRAG